MGREKREEGTPIPVGGPIDPDNMTESQSGEDLEPTDDEDDGDEAEEVDA